MEFGLGAKRFRKSGETELGGRGQIQSNIPGIQFTLISETTRNKSEWRWKSSLLVEDVTSIYRTLLVVLTKSEEGYEAVQQFIHRFKYLAENSEDDLNSALSSFGTEFEQLTITEYNVEPVPDIETAIADDPAIVTMNKKMEPSRTKSKRKISDMTLGKIRFNIFNNETNKSTEVSKTMNQLVSVQMNEASNTQRKKKEIVSKPAVRGHKVGQNKPDKRVPKHTEGEPTVNQSKTKERVPKGTIIRDSTVDQYKATESVPKDTIIRESTVDQTKPEERVPKLAVRRPTVDSTKPKVYLKLRDLSMLTDSAALAKAPDVESDTGNVAGLTVRHYPCISESEYTLTPVSDSASVHMLPALSTLQSAVDLMPDAAASLSDIDLMPAVAASQSAVDLLSDVAASQSAVYLMPAVATLQSAVDLMPAAAATHSTADLGKNVNIKQSDARMWFSTIPSTGLGPFFTISTPKSACNKQSDLEIQSDDVWQSIHCTQTVDEIFQTIHETITVEDHPTADAVATKGQKSSQRMLLAVNNNVMASGPSQSNVFKLKGRDPKKTSLSTMKL